MALFAVIASFRIAAPYVDAFPGSRLLIARGHWFSPAAIVGKRRLVKQKHTHLDRPQIKFTIVVLGKLQGTSCL